MKSYGVSLEVVKTEIKTTEEMSKKYSNNGYNKACALEIAQALQIDSGLAESRSR